MIFVGGGSLLSHAVAHALASGLDVALVCCPVGDSALPKLRRAGVPILETDAPDADLLPRLTARAGGPVLSVNNRHILGDALLRAGPEFFNVHNGLVQTYRGLAEVCVFAALCAGEARYGATLHRLLPGQRVDAGPVAAQRAFALGPGDDFDAVMTRALGCCRTLLEETIVGLDRGERDAERVPLAGRAYAYRDVAALCAGADPDRLARASNLGAYRHFFPRLAALIAANRTA